MDPALSKFINLANDIAESRRWATVNENLARLAKSGAGEAWWTRVFSALAAQLFSEYLSLKEAHGNARAEPALMAWRARNLLEITVWCIYCSKSRENARRLFEDAGRDVREMIDGFKKWGIAANMQGDWMEYFKAAEQDLSRRAASAGVGSLDGSYKRVSAAANNCGLGDHFRLTHGFLSKFVHPTAMQIVSEKDEARAAFQKDLFFSHGCLYFTGGFTALEDRIVRGSENVANVASITGSSSDS
ncbi:MAG: DUF5677 domain-containing protein [Candidatus Acidiferrales bacterium]|jgi:hypothetical protein